MKTVIYVWKSPYPWDVRVEKICNSLYKNNFNVYLLARWTKNQPEREVINGINIIRVGYKKPFSFSVPLSSNPIWKKAIIKAVEEIKPDIIIPREIMLAEASGKVGKKYGIPVIMDMAEHYPAAMKGWNKYYNNFFKRMAVHYFHLPELVEKKSVKLMDGIITVSNELSNRLNKIFSFDKKKIQVVYNTPDLTLFDGIRTGSSQPPIEFAYHGFMTKDRNLDKLLRGFIIIAQQLPQIKLTLSGSGESYNDLIAIARNSNCYERILFTGSYNHSEIKNLYSQMDIGILPFKNNEFINHIIANKFFDYISVGKPIITSNAKPMANILSEINAGISVDCSDENEIAQAIFRICDMDLIAMSANGIKAAKEKYNWDIDSRNMIEFINRII